MAWIAIAAIATVATACGAIGSGPALSPSPTQAASTSHSPSPGAKLFSFQLNPEPTVKATGTITLTADQSTTSIELKITGLLPNSSHVSHVHVGGCPQSARGGIAFALNQVVADGEGTADTMTSLNVSYPPATGKWYVVVHAGPDMQGTSASYLMCGNLF
jgi:Cu/Zn superoxide dismutase